MLRTLGFQKNQLVVLLVLQSILISIPSTLVGFIILGIVGTGTQIFVYGYLDIAINLTLTPWTYLIGFAIGFGLPLISNIYPIRQALGTKLRDALDLSR